MSPGSWRWYAIFLGAFAFGSVAHAEDSLSLTVKVTGASANSGQAICSIFDSAADYLESPVTSATLPIDASGAVVFVFSGLAPGVYAVSVVYDEDSNGELNTGFLGIPTELVAMSNNAKGRFGPPSFKKTRFELKSDQAIEVVFSEAKQ